MGERNTEMRGTEQISIPVAASTKVEAGKIACANASGYAVEGSVSATLTYLGRFDETIDNSSGANGDLDVLIRRDKCFKWDNSSTDAVDQSCLGQECYIEDDETVCATDNSGTRSAAGVVVGVDSDGVWVENPKLAVTYDDGWVASSVIQITTAELKALNATPKTLVAAPGAGKANILEACQAFLDYESAAYADIAAGDDININYTDDSGDTVATIECTGFLDQTNDEYRWAKPVITNVTPVANAALVAHMATGEVTTGDSPLYLKVWYRQITLALSV